MQIPDFSPNLIFGSVNPATPARHLRRQTQRIQRASSFFSSRRPRHAHAVLKKCEIPIFRPTLLKSWLHILFPYQSLQCDHKQPKKLAPKIIICIFRLFPCQAHSITIDVFCASAGFVGGPVIAWRILKGGCSGMCRGKEDMNGDAASFCCFNR